MKCARSTQRWGQIDVRQVAVRRHALSGRDRARRALSHPRGNEQT